MAIAYSGPSGLWLLDKQYHGSHSSAVGTTKNVGPPATPVRRRVRLHHQPTGRLVREVWSGETTGAYQFTALRAGTYYVTAFDHTGEFNGEIMTDVVIPPPGG